MCLPLDMIHSLDPFPNPSSLVSCNVPLDLQVALPTAEEIPAVLQGAPALKVPMEWARLRVLRL